MLCLSGFELYFRWVPLMQAYNTVGRCFVSGCNNTKEEENDFPIHEIPFYGDSRPKASKEDESRSLS